MPTTTLSSPSRDARAEPRGNGLAVLLLAISAFVIVTTEFIIVGLLPSLSRDLGISIAAAGQLVTLFAFTVMLAGPFLTAMLSHFERKRLFVVILLIFAGANALAAAAPNIWILGFARFLPALALPVFWGTASETAGELAGPERAGKAVANVYLGISGAMVLGIPLGTLASEAFGWRGTFWGLSGLSLVMGAMLFLVMPTLAKPPRVKLAEQAKILKDPYFLGNVILSVVVFTAMFTAYTYLADTLQQIAHIPAGQVGWWLMGFGIVGLGGNWLGGQFVGRGPLLVTAIAALVLAIGVAATTLLAGSPVWLGVALAVWGVANTALYPICQVRVMQSASHAQALAGTLNVSMANAGIGLGAIIGGTIILHWGLPSVGYVAAGIALLAVLLTPLVVRLKARAAG
ncbi:MFS transporter [Sphingomonas sp. CARO-RG-8B-R24-01]|uniref:MFS transporter n=1 Tax=Sphingomonas sp. CARO-RG-8B-R24-01 TaxID=2914831 RepID=UPI001F581CB0|nr:MFS transporter [Sphingomonas sp. CARO-RG-8B-R24-01]